ncbi:hypothetical protein R6Q57_022130 [Mikania cordata]
MSSSATQTTVNRRLLYRQTFGILNANSLHFIAISLLFLPLTFAALQFYSSGIDLTTKFNILLTFKTLATVLAVSFSVILPTVAGVALITYSTNQAIHRKPLTLSSTVKSLSHSYIPLLQTFFAGNHCAVFYINLGIGSSDYGVGIKIRIRGSTTKRESIDGVSTSLIFHIVHHRIRHRHGAGKFDRFAKFRSDIELDLDLAGRYLVFGTVIDNFAVCGGELGVVCAVQDSKRGRDCYGNGGRGGFRRQRRRVC